MSFDTVKLIFRFSIFWCITFGTDDTFSHISIFSKNVKMLKRRKHLKLRQNFFFVAGAIRSYHSLLT